MPSERFDFPNARGEKLSALLDRPAGQPVAFALFAHCFTCGKDNLAAKRIAEGLTARGIAVLRFDFTGLGASEGEFANTTFFIQRRRPGRRREPPAQDASGARDPDRPQPRRRRRARRREPGAGGARGRDHRGAAPIRTTSPACSRSASPRSTRRARSRSRSPGRPFRIRKEFLDDVAKQKLEQCLARPAQGAAGAAFADRRSGRHRARERDLHRREAPEELRVAQRRRSSAQQAARCGLRRRGDRRLVGALSRHGAGAGRDADRGRAGRRDAQRQVRAVGGRRQAPLSRRRAGVGRRQRQRAEPVRISARGPRRLHVDDDPALCRPEEDPARARVGAAQARQDPCGGLRGVRDQGRQDRPHRPRDHGSRASCRPSSAPS